MQLHITSNILESGFLCVLHKTIIIKKEHRRIKAAMFILEHLVRMKENDSGQV